MEKRFLRSYEFNNVRVLNELAKIVENNNGTIIYKSYMHELEYENRSYISILNDSKLRLEKLTKIENENPGTNEKRTSAIKKLEDTIEGLETSKPRNIISKLSNYISFVIDDTYYYLQLNDNPFMEDLYHKIAINNGCYFGSYYLDELDKKERVYDCLLSYDCCDSDIKEIANIIFNMLIKANYSKKVYTRKRIKNIYDTSYHYENIPENANKKTNVYK